MRLLPTSYPTTFLLGSSCPTPSLYLPRSFRSSRDQDVNPLVRFRALAGQDRDAVFAHLKAAVPDVACLTRRVARPLQRLGKLVFRQTRALFNNARRGIESGVASQVTAGDLLINQLGKTAI